MSNMKDISSFLLHYISHNKRFKKSYKMYTMFKEFTFVQGGRGRSP